MPRVVPKGEHEKIIAIPKAEKDNARTAPALRPMGGFTLTVALVTAARTVWSMVSASVVIGFHWRNSPAWTAKEAWSCFRILLTTRYDR